MTNIRLETYDSYLDKTAQQRARAEAARSAVVSAAWHHVRRKLAAGRAKWASSVATGKGVVGH